MKERCAIFLRGVEVSLDGIFGPKKQFDISSGKLHVRRASRMHPGWWVGYFRVKFLHDTKSSITSISAGYDYI